MNEFTKEELFSLSDAMEHSVQRDNDDDEIHDQWASAYTKIQSMIDLYDAEVIKVWHCEKCGHVQ